MNSDKVGSHAFFTQASLPCLSSLSQIHHAVTSIIIVWWWFKPDSAFILTTEASAAPPAPRCQKHTLTTFAGDEGWLK